MPMRCIVYSSCESVDARAPLQMMDRIVWPERHACLSNLAMACGCVIFVTRACGRSGEDGSVVMTRL